MDLWFEPGDDGRFETVKEQLSAEFSARHLNDPLDISEIDLELFLDWKFRHADGRLDRVDIDEVGEFLMGYCFDRLVLSAREASRIVAALRAWIVDLVIDGRWKGGPPRPLLDMIEEMRPGFVEAVATAEEKLFAQDLPVTPVVDADSAARDAARAPIIGQIDDLRRYLGEGVPLTSSGIPEPIDLEQMMVVLDTDDIRQHVVDDEVRSMRSTDVPAHLLFLVRVAVDAGALDDDGTSLRPSDGWEELDPVQRCSRLFDAAIEIGTVSGTTLAARPGTGVEAIDPFDILLDQTAAHMLVEVFIGGWEEIDACVHRAIRSVRGTIDPAGAEGADGGVADGLVELAINRSFETFERMGAVVLRDRQEHTESFGVGTVRSGGIIVLTELGRLLLENLLPRLGYVVHHSTELTDAEAADAVMMLATSEMDPAEVWREWAPDADPVDKFDELMDVLSMAETGPERLAAVALMEQAPFAVRRRAEAMIAGPRAAYALMSIDPLESPFSGPMPPEALVVEPGTPGENGHRIGEDGGEPWFDDDDWGDGIVRLSDGRSISAAIQQLGPELNLAPLVDLLWLEMDVDPDDLIGHVMSIDVGEPEAGIESGTFTALLGDMWKVDLPETVQLLDFLAENHPVAETASIARDAAARHRGTYPDR